MIPNLKEEWKIFCRGLYRNLLLMEKSAEIEIETSFKTNKPFSDRQRLINKLKFCEEYKAKVIYSVSHKEFNLGDGDEEIILNLGATYYFKFREPTL